MTDSKSIQDIDRNSPSATIPESPVEGPMPAPVLEPPIGILLVDDEVNNLLVLESILGNPQYKLVRAETVDQALFALIHEDFALMVLDVQMPVMSGFELAAMIKKRRKTANLPIIFLTAHYGESEHVLEGYETGAVDYLHKPVNPIILRSKVAVFAELYRRNREIVSMNRALTEEVGERRRIQSQLIELNNQLEDRVEERTCELQSTNLALIASEQQSERAQRAGKVGVWDWNIRSGQGTWSRTAWDIFGLQGHSGMVSRDTWLNCIHPLDRDEALRKFEAATKSGEYHDEFRLALPDHKLTWVEAVGAVDFEDGEPVRMLGAIRDITDKKLVEHKLIEANKLKDQFLAMLGHELRNPLAPIRNAVSILRESGAKPQQLHWCLDVLDRQATQLTRIVDDLLDISRISRGIVRMECTELDLGLAIRHAIEACRPLVESRQQILHVQMPPETVWINGNLARLTQIVANLINNASKYSEPQGRIWLELEIATADRILAILKVRDEGRGFEAEKKDQLFELFYQVDSTLDRAEGGLGIGLALVRNLTLLHGGSVDAISRGLGMGSEFIVRLPCTVEPARPTVVDPVPPARENVCARILVVDDNHDSLDSMAMLLRFRGHHVTEATDGLEAVAKALQDFPEIIVMDIGLPGLNGYEACRKIRESGLDETLIIAMTGFGQAQDRDCALSSGFDAHLVKPVNVREIMSLIDNHLSHVRAD